MMLDCRIIQNVFWGEIIQNVSCNLGYRFVREVEIRRIADVECMSLID